MSELPLVSIVTPSFNMGRYLEATIRSVVEQDYPNLEYIIMDGGSSDDSVEIIRRYEKRLAYWTSGPDGGQSAAITAGWKRCTGEIMAEIDASDLLAPHSIARAVEAFVKHPEWGMLYSDTVWIDEQCRVLKPWKSREFEVADMLCGNHISQPTVFMRRRCLEAVGYYNPEFHMSMDFDLWMRMGLEFPIGYLANETLAFMRWHDDSKTFKSARSFLPENLRVIDQTLNSGKWRSQKKKLRPPAVGCAYGRHAGYCIREGRYSEARHALWAMLKTGSLEPWRRYGRDLPYIITSAFLGGAIAEKIRSLKRVFLRKMA